MLYPVDLPRRTSLETRAGCVGAAAPSTIRHFTVAVRRAALAISLPAALLIGAAVPVSSSVAVETAPITASVARATTSGALQLGAPRVNAPAVGTVTTSALNLRTGPGTEYAVITVLGYGTQGTVLGQSNGWYNVQTNLGTGWVSGTYFSVGSTPAPAAPAPAPASGTGYVTTSALNLRTGPGTGYGVITVLGYGTQGTIVAQANGWYNIQTTVGTGWVIGTYFSVGGAPAAPAPTPAPPAPAPAPASNVAAIALQYVGYPYVYGAAGPNAFDCSGLAQYVYARAGISITRTTYTQWDTPGTRIYSYAGLQPGDLVFFANTAGPGITHVAIYVGNGQMVSAGTPATGVELTNINYSYWVSHFAGGVRPYR